MRFVFGPSALLLSSFARTHSQPLFLSLSSCLHPFYLNWMCSFPLPPLPAPPSSSLSLLFCCGSTDSTVQAVYKLISFRRYLCNCSSCCEFSVFFLFVHSLNCSIPFCRGPLYILVRRVVAKIVLQNSILQFLHPVHIEHILSDIYIIHWCTLCAAYFNLIKFHHAILHTISYEYTC